MSILVAVAIKFFMQPVKKISNMVAMQCSCSLDIILSSEQQKKITQFIREFHQSTQNPSQVIEKVVQTFPEIKEMQAEICSADTICFNAQAVKPIFLLNNDLIISDTHASFKKENLDSAIIALLPKIYSKKNDQYQDMIDFINQTPQELTKNNTISWMDKDLIIFRPITNENIAFLVSISLIPSLELFQNCYELYNQKLKQSFKKNNKTMVEYDIRFKNQIIVRFGGAHG